MNRLVGLKVKSVFFYRGAKVYIRHKGHFFEFIIVLKKWLWRSPDVFTHYFEFKPPVNTKRELMDEEVIRSLLAIQDVARETVDKIVSERSLKEELNKLLQDGRKTVFASYKRFERFYRKAKRKFLSSQEREVGTEATRPVELSKLNEKEA